jgi:acetoin utilization deacetylase AcuC-like enzyme
MKKVGFLYDEIFLQHEMPLGHPESKDRLIALTTELRNSYVWDKLIQIKPRRADRNDILAVHTEEYYNKILNFTGHYDVDTYVSEHSVEAALVAAGAVLEAVDNCKRGLIDRAFCAVRPPGHHAETNRAMGFCIFNNIAVGARYAQKQGYGKVFIVDFDLHHGNGTQHIFEDDDTVFYFSTHEYPQYPGTGADGERGTDRGKGFTYNIPMLYGAGDKDFFAAFHDYLPLQMRSFAPDIILVSAGYDLHGKDPLGGLRVTSEGIRSIVRSILQGCPGVPSIFCLEGGYNVQSLSESVLITVEELLTCA